MNVLVIDNGLYVELALILGRSGLFDRVGYYTRWEEDFPYTKDAVIGAGFDEITREMDLFFALNEYDAFVFPDNYWGGCQAFIRHVLHKPVWGSGMHDELELNRMFLRRAMENRRLPVPQYRVDEGIADLLEDHRLEEGDFIKINRYRGLMETTKFEGWDSPDWLYDVSKDLGPFASSFPFIIEKPLNGVEIGFDGIFVGGELLYPCLLGIEKKDAGYLGKVTDTLPAAQAKVARALETMVDDTYNNFLSVELRGDVLLDLTTRMPQPPGHGMLTLFKGLSSAIHDQLNDPITYPNFDATGNWLAMIILKRTNTDRYMKVTLSDEAKDYAKFSRTFKYHNELWVSPGKANEIGTVSGIGDTPKEAQKMALEVLKGVEADDLHTTGAKDGFDELNEAWDDANREGAA